MARIASTKTAALAFVALSLGAIAGTSSAQAGPWHHGHGWRWGAAAAGGLLVGSVIASRAYAAPVAVEEAAPACYTVERFNRYGDVIGYRRVCRPVY